MVSGRPSALYDDLLRDWRRIAVQVTTRVRTEVVWLNFEPGRNRTDRQRIKRKAGGAAMRISTATELTFIVDANGYRRARVMKKLLPATGLTRAHPGP